MSDATPQMNTWAGDFGREYTDRNPQSTEELNALYLRLYGLPRSELNERFLGGMDRSIRILEVGCNIGNQLECLQGQGFNPSRPPNELEPYTFESVA